MVLTREQVNSRLEAIAKMINKSGTVQNAIGAARKYGRKWKEVGNSNTHKTYEYLDDHLYVNYQTGRNMFGHACLEVRYGAQGKQKTVLEATNTPDDGDIRVSVNEGIVGISELHVSLYHPGKWEEELRKIARKGPSKKKVKKEPEVVPKEELRTLRCRFGKLI